jgi:signal transduction histidine kinase
MNLINNGLKFTKTKQLYYNGQLSFQENTLTFKIIDGIGIAADKLETVLKVLLRVQLRLIENMAVQD